MRIFFQENIIIDYHTRILIIIELSNKDTKIRFPFLTVGRIYMAMG